MPKPTTKDDPTPLPIDAQRGPAGIPDDAIEVWDRLALYGDDGLGAAPIALNVPGRWYCRWINTALDGRWNTVVHRKRFIPVAVKELSDPRALTGFNASPEGYVTRGDRGQEVLVRIPQDVWDRIQHGKAERLNAKAQSASAQKEELQHALAGQYGPQAAEAVRDFRGTVTSGTVLESREE